MMAFNANLAELGINCENRKLHVEPSENFLLYSILYIVDTCTEHNYKTRAVPIL